MIHQSQRLSSGLEAGQNLLGVYARLDELDRDHAFFFSSRRRHTRCGRDWSSDVCSSDLACDGDTAVMDVPDTTVNEAAGTSPKLTPVARSEERRVGKECRSRWSPYH